MTESELQEQLEAVTRESAHRARGWNAARSELERVQAAMVYYRDETEAAQSELTQLRSERDVFKRLYEGCREALGKSDAELFDEAQRLRSEIAELKKPVDDDAIEALLSRLAGEVPGKLWGAREDAIDLIRRLHRELQDARGKR